MKKGSGLPGQPKSEEHKQKIRKAMTGRKHSKETKEKMSFSRMGHIVTAETRLKIGKATFKHGIDYNPKGYKIVLIGRNHPMADSRGRILEHRLIMANHLGRILKKEEVVHHKLECEGGTGEVDDNRIENLLLFSNQSEHLAHHKNLRRKYGSWKNY